MRPKCPLCNRGLVVPSGPKDSPILLVGEFPGERELERGVPWVGRAGEILEEELLGAGIKMAKCRMTNLWQHEPDWKSKEEYDWHFRQMTQEFKGRKAILFMGSDLSLRLFHKSVSELNGLSPTWTWMPSSVKVAIVCFNPAMAMHGVIGEIRFAIGRFGELVRKEGIL